MNPPPSPFDETVTHIMSSIEYCDVLHDEYGKYIGHVPTAELISRS